MSEEIDNLVQENQALKEQLSNWEAFGRKVIESQNDERLSSAGTMGLIAVLVNLISAAEDLLLVE